MAQGHQKYRPTHPRSLGVIGQDKTRVSSRREVMGSRRITGGVFLFEEVEKHRKSIIFREEIFVEFQATVAASSRTS